MSTAYIINMGAAYCDVQVVWVLNVHMLYPVYTRHIFIRNALARVCQFMKCQKLEMSRLKLQNIISTMFGYRSRNSRALGLMG